MHWVWLGVLTSGQPLPSSFLLALTCRPRETPWPWQSLWWADRQAGIWPRKLSFSCSLEEFRFAWWCPKSCLSECAWRQVSSHWRYLESSQQTKISFSHPHLPIGLSLSLSAAPALFLLFFFPPLSHSSQESKASLSPFLLSSSLTHSSQRSKSHWALKHDIRLKHIKNLKNPTWGYWDI